MKNFIDGITSCDTCRLRMNCTRVVPGEGDPHAEIMFIGEAPGRQEELLGRPFVGAAGRLLNRLLKVINIKREDVYITNLVKCRPPQNRDPLPEEIESCSEWLNEQIRSVRPKLIVLLGRLATNRFLPKVRISEVHGRNFMKDIIGLGTFVFFPTYHPAAALYNKSLEKSLEDDFKKIPELLAKTAELLTKAEGESDRKAGSNG
jgi:uracil-DNA glycosylase family 4